MDTNITTWLLSNGLSDQRAALYIEALKLGEASASQLSDATKIKRTATYDNLKFLEKQGYVTILKKGKRKLFVPTHPNELYKNIERKKEQLKDLLPDFMSIYGEGGTAPFVQMFTGKFAAREVYEDILLSAKEEYLYFSPQQLTLQRVNEGYMRKWIERRVRKGLKSRSLRVKSQELSSDELFSGESKYKRQIRFLPEYVELHTAIYIYEGNIAVIATKQEGVAFIINSPNLAFSFKQIFEFLWSVSKKS